jgi:formate hydrogenlyase transcriptional activator
MNLLSQKNIVQGENELKFFLSFNRELAIVKNRIELSNLINELLKNLLNFDYSTIFLFSDDKGTVDDFLFDQESQFTDYPFRRSISAENFETNSSDERSEIHNTASFINDGQDYHIKEGLALKLYGGSRVIGFWVILYKKPLQLKEEQLGFLRLLTGELALSVIRIKTEEINLEWEIIREILLSLNIDFASTRDRNDLAEILHLKLKKLFSFMHHGVAVINDDQLTTTSFLQDSASPAKKHPKYQHIIQTNYPINDGVLDKVILSKEPYLLDLDQLSARSNLPEYAQMLYDSGIKNVVMTPLTRESRVIGFWSIYLVKDQKMSARQLNLIKAISSQVSGAVENILINEAIKAKEAEDKLLLNLSFIITGIRNRSDLVNMINTHVKKLLHFQNIVIEVLNQDHPNNSFVICSDDQYNNYYAGNKNALNLFSPGRNYLTKVLEPGDIQILDLEQIYHSESCPDNIKHEYENGIREKVIVAMQVEGKTTAVFCINSSIKGRYTEHVLELIKGVSYQVSISLSNILANEDISKREREKALLLSFSNDLATVRDKKGLGVVIKRYLKNIFLISEYVITIKNDDNKTYSYFLYDLVENTPTDKEFQTIINSNIPTVGSLTAAVLQSEEPVIFDIDDILQNNKFRAPGASFWKAIGAKKILGARLKVANEDIGMLWVEAGIINDHLLNGITAQIAIALANAIANDKVERQLREINRYKKQLEEEKIYLKEEIEFLHNNSEIVGKGPGMKKISQLIAQVAQTETTVIILGETGTGKELIARAIHNNSPRKNKLMVKVNCAAIPANLIESELFGHERGSFTGATERRIGKFELAHNGTLFLDEIGEMPLDLQVKLLRALQEKEIERVGGKGTINVDVRIIAATNRDLEKEMEEGRFRRDLYYRLYIFPIELPPLRDRRDDIPLLASHFILRYAKKLGKPIQSLSAGALNELMEYNWPGNIRELEHSIERSILLTSGNTIKQIHLPSKKQETASKRDFVIQTLFENEREHIYNTLKYCNNRVGGEGGAAQLLGVPASTLNSKMKKLKIKKEHNLQN